MSPFSPVALILILLPSNAITSYLITLELYYYSLSVIEFLSAQHSGVFTCVFYDKRPDHPQDNILELLMMSPELDHIPKYSIDGSLPEVEFGYLPPNPSLILYRAGNEHFSFDQQMFATLNLFHQNTKLLVFVDCTSFEYFQVNSAVLAELLRFNKVVYLCTTHLTVARTEMDWKVVTELEYYPAPGELFQDGVRDLRGSVVTYTWRMVENRVEDVVLDPLALWIQETARFLNGTSAPMPCSCEFKVRMFEECYWEFLKSGKIDFAIDGIQARGMVPGNFRLIYSTVPVSDYLVVPSGRPLNIVELFFVPFTWSAWLLIGSVFVATELFSIAKPTLFRNDPVMIVVCSFERYNLHHAGRLEQFVLLSLIIMFFFVSNAFETKVIALMTAKPSLNIPRTFQDLVELGMPIRADLRLDPQLVNNTEIGSLVVHSILNVIDLDGKSAYKADFYWAEFMKLVPSVESYHRQLRYHVLEQILGIRIRGIFTGFRSPLLEQFERTMILFEESGITTHWTLKLLMLAHLWLSSINIIFPKVLPYKLEDLTLAWVVLAVGLVAGLAVFVIEISVRNCRTVVVVCSKGILKIYSKFKIKFE